MNIKVNVIRSLRVFRIRREERSIALVCLLLLMGLNSLCIQHYWSLFSPLNDNYWQLFIGKFQVSGFDPITYYVGSHWEARYNVYRHPLLSFFVWPLYAVNRGCMALFGVNCVQLLVAMMLVLAALYAFLFIYRMLRGVVRLEHVDAALLAFFCYGFAYVMISAMVPDHFMLSFFALTLTLYVSGMHIRRHTPMPVWQAVVLFFGAAGISLTNGVKVFLSSLFCDGRYFFKWRNLLFGVAFPALLLWVGARYEYHYLVAPGEIARHKARQEARAQQARQQQAKSGKKAVRAKPRTSGQPAVSKNTKPLMHGEFMRWTDISTPRGTSVVENMLGESLQLHPDYLLQDEFKHRPVIVTYRWAVNYVVEGIIVLLFLAGIWCGRRSRFLWLCLSWLATDVVLHVVLGFGLNEVYIMTCQWAFLLPMVTGFAFRPQGRRVVVLRRLTLILLTAWLYLYNGYYLISYFT